MGIEFCVSCRKVLFEKTQVVDHDSDYIFCSEDCINEFFAPVISYLSHGKGEETDSIDDDVLEILTKSPDEIREVYISHHFKMYTHLLTHNRYTSNPEHFVLYCSYLDNSPSFIFGFFKVAGLDTFRQGELVYEKDKQVEVLDILEGKKNEFLSELLVKRSELDIPFENFHYYQKYQDETIENHTEAFKDPDDTEFGYFVKKFDGAEETFYFIVYGHYSTGIIHAVLGYPSIDQAYFNSLRELEKLVL